jgi:phosphonate utilization associated putative membrane protein
MTLSWQVMLAVLFGALLHAAWNATVKASTDKSLDIALIHLLCSMLGLPLLGFFGWPPAHVWPYIIGSVVIHIGYYIALSGAYENGELGLTYPLMRGTAPLLVALSATVSVGESLRPLAWAGVLGICSGVLVLGLSKNALNSSTRGKAVMFALMNAVFIALYTVVDALGVRASGNAMQYVVALFVLDGWPFALLVFYRRRFKVWHYAAQRWPVGLMGAIASMTSYSIALWAMTKAPVATVAALRETSVLFAALIGTWFLKEAFTIRRGIGTAAIVVGAILLRLS